MNGGSRRRKDASTSEEAGDHCYGTCVDRGQARRDRDGAHVYEPRRVRHPLRSFCVWRRGNLAQWRCRRLGFVCWVGSGNGDDRWNEKEPKEQALEPDDLVPRQLSALHERPSIITWGGGRGRGEAGVRTCSASRPQGGMCDEVRNDYQRLTESGGMCGRVSVFFVLVFLFAEPGTCCVECRRDIETGSGHARIGWDGRRWVRRLSVVIRCQNDDSLCVTSVPCTSERPQDEKR